MGQRTPFGIQRAITKNGTIKEQQRNYLYKSTTEPSIFHQI